MDRAYIFFSQTRGEGRPGYKDSASDFPFILGTPLQEWRQGKEWKTYGYSKGDAEEQKKPKYWSLVTSVYEEVLYTLLGHCE